MPPDPSLHAIDWYPLPEFDANGRRPYRTSGFGLRVDPIRGGIKGHGGVDDACAAGTAIIAPVAGLLNQGWDRGGGGNWSMLWGEDDWVYGFGHARAYYDPDGNGPATSLNGYRVHAGQTIAYVGTTGASTGNHLHFAMRHVSSSLWQDPTATLARAAREGRYIDRRTTPVTPVTSTPIEDIMAVSPEQAEEIISRIVTREVANQDIRMNAVITSRLDHLIAQIDPNGDAEHTHRSLVERIVNKLEA